MNNNKAFKNEFKLIFVTHCVSERVLRGHNLLAYFNWVDGQGHADHSSMTMYKFKRITTFRLANIAHRNDGGGLNYIL